MIVKSRWELNEVSSWCSAALAFQARSESAFPRIRNQQDAGVQQGILSNGTDRLSLFACHMPRMLHFIPFVFICLSRAADVVFCVTNLNTGHSGCASYLEFPSLPAAAGRHGAPAPCFSLAWDQTWPGLFIPPLCSVLLFYFSCSQHWINLKF